MTLSTSNTRGTLCRIANLMVATSLCLALVACEATRDANDSVAKINKLTSKQQHQLRAAQRGEIIYEAQPYYGEAVVVERGARSGKPLPAKAEGARSFVLSGQRLSIQNLAEEISKQTGILAQVRTHYITPEGGSLTVPASGTVKLNHEGSLSKALDKVAAILDVDWSYDGTAIAFNRMVDRDYLVSLPTGTSSMQTSINGVSGGSRSVTMNRNIDEFSAWDELERLLARAAPPPGNVSISRTSGRISVFGPPSVQKRAAKVIENIEKTFSARIGLEVAVFFVDAEKSDDFGLDLKLAGTSGSFAGSGGVLTGNGVATFSHGANSVSFKALAQDSSVVDYRIGSTIAQSGVISPIILTSAQNYVSKATTTTTNGVSSTALETATIDTGISIHALPRLIGSDKIQLSLTVLQNDLTKLESFQSGTSTVQLPTVDQRAIQNESVLSPGETLVLSGYEQESASRSNKGTGISKFLGLGGNVKGAKRKIKMVVMVRPAIIPLGRT